MPTNKGHQHSPMPTNTPTSRTLRSNSNPNNNITLTDIKMLIENTKTEILESLTKKIDEMSKNLASVITRLDTLENENKNLSRRCIELEEKIQERNSEFPENFAHEIYMRQQKQDNLIISGLPEASSGSLDERKTHDLKELNSLAAELGMTNLSIKDTQRVGPTNKRPRLLRIKLTDWKVKVELLRRAKVLRNSVRYRSCYISPDLTPLQRQNQKELQEQAKKMREEGHDVIISKGKVILRSEKSNGRTTNFL